MLFFSPILVVSRNERVSCMAPGCFGSIDSVSSLGEASRISLRSIPEKEVHASPMSKYRHKTRVSPFCGFARFYKYYAHETVSPDYFRKIVFARLLGRIYARPPRRDDTRVEEDRTTIGATHTKE